MNSRNCSSRGAATASDRKPIAKYTTKINTLQVLPQAENIDREFMVVDLGIEGGLQGRTVLNLLSSVLCAENHERGH